MAILLVPFSLNQYANVRDTFVEEYQARKTSNYEYCSQDSITERLYHNFYLLFTCSSVKGVAFVEDCGGYLDKSCGNHTSLNWS